MDIERELTGWWEGEKRRRGTSGAACRRFICGRSLPLPKDQVCQPNRKRTHEAPNSPHPSFSHDSRAAHERSRALRRPKHLSSRYQIPRRCDKTPATRGPATGVCPIQDCPHSAYSMPETNAVDGNTGETKRNERITPSLPPQAPWPQLPSDNAALNPADSRRPVRRTVPSPGAGPDALPTPPDRRAISARIALSHLISSSSLGAQSSSVRFGVITLNVCAEPSPSSLCPCPCTAGPDGEGAAGGECGRCFAAGNGTSTSSASTI